MWNKRGLKKVYLLLGEESVPAVCMRRCRTEGEGFAYAGIQFGRECFCGNVPPPTNMIVDETQCDMPCRAGDQNILCTGSLRMYVYYTGKEQFVEGS